MYKASSVNTITMNEIMFTIFLNVDEVDNNISERLGRTRNDPIRAGGGCKGAQTKAPKRPKQCDSKEVE